MHHVCSLRYRGQRSFFLWYTDDPTPDGVVLDKAKRLLSFCSSRQAHAFGRRQKLAVSKIRPFAYDLDTLADWVKSPSAREVDCVKFLNAWNLFSDLAHSSGASFDSDRKRNARIYAKLFAGNNLPAVTPADEKYVPVWNDREITRLRNFFHIGLKLTRRCIRVARKA
jgi:hypothetical protein